MARVSARVISLAATVGAAAAGVLFFVASYPDLIFDSDSYAVLARFVSHGRLFPDFVDFRTYGYPLFVALCTGFRDLSPPVVRLAVFLVQLVLFIGACAIGARRLGEITGSRRFAVIAYVLTVANPFLLARASETLSDSLSAVLVYLGILWILPPRRVPEGPPRRVAAKAAGALLCLAFATMVRPSNLPVLFVGVSLLAFRQALWREMRWNAAPWLLAAGLLPFAPQVYTNLRVFGKFQPLIVRSLYRDQTRWGMGAIKYGTLVRPPEEPYLVYRNPFYHWEPTAPFFLRTRPAAYLATLALHLFAMFDNDFLFTYVTDLHPAYRWPLSILGYVLLFLCLAGVAAFGKALRREGWRSPPGFAGLGLIAAAAASVVLYVPTLVESRFAAPALLLLSPFAARAIEEIGELRARGRTRVFAAWILAGILFVGGCARLSAWVSAQAPLLAAPPSPAALAPKA
jgi:hypothetical protein